MSGQRAVVRDKQRVRTQSPLSVQRKRGVGEMSGQRALDRAFDYAVARDKQRARTQSPPRTDWSRDLIAAGRVIVDFMVAKVGNFKSTRAVALSTIPPSPNGVDTKLAKTLGSLRYQTFIRKQDTQRAMERFIMKSGFCVGMLLHNVTVDKIKKNPNTFKWRRATYSTCSRRVMNSFDVIGNPAKYAGLGISISVSDELQQAAYALGSNFEAMRFQVVRGGVPAIDCTSTAERAQLCFEIKRYGRAENKWKIESFKGFVNQVSSERHTLCHMLSILTMGANLDPTSPSRPRWLREEASRLEAHIDVLDAGFTRKTFGTEGMELVLEEMQACCQIAYPHVPLYDAPCLVACIPTTYKTEEQLEDGRIDCNMRSFRMDNLVLHGSRFNEVPPNP